MVLIRPYESHNEAKAALKVEMFGTKKVRNQEEEKGSEAGKKVRRSQREEKAGRGYYDTYATVCTHAHDKGQRPSKKGCP